VAKSTAYFSLQDDPRISKDTRLRVQRAAKLLGYRPRASARALRGGKTHTIGVIFTHERPRLRALFARYSVALERIGDILADRNYHVALAGGIAPSERPARLPRLFREVAMDGALVVYTLSDALQKELETLRVPFVVFDGPAPPGIHSVLVDECGLAEKAVMHLVGLGHRRVASLATTRAPRSITHRMWQYPRGFARGMARAGLIPNPGWDDPMPVEERLEKLWREPETPTALIGYDELDAGKTILWLRSRGLRVPTDVSVVALLDKGHAELTGMFGLPSISCGANLQSEMASSAVKALLTMVENPGTSVPPNKLMESRIVQRESSGPVKPG